MSESIQRARYTLEFKLEAVRLVKGGQVAAVTAKILGIPKQTLENWVRLHPEFDTKMPILRFWRSRLYINQRLTRTFSEVV
jgi:transposase-like protein